MRLVRNVYFWLVLGTIAFIGGMAWSSSSWEHMSRKDRDEARADREAEDKDPEPITGFGAGFMTACAVGLFWFAVHCQANVKPNQDRDNQ